MLMNGRINKMHLYDVPLTFMGKTKLIRVAAKNKNTPKPIMFIGRKQLKQFCVSSVEAELTKYMQNVFNTYRILFANASYDICKENGVIYNSVLESLLERNELDDKYMKCSDELRGPSGPCLVKDTLAFDKYVSTLIIKCDLFRTIVKDMQLYPKTVIEGTRTEKEYFGGNINNLNK